MCSTLHIPAPLAACKPHVSFLHHVINTNGSTLHQVTGHPSDLLNGNVGAQVRGTSSLVCTSQSHVHFAFLTS